MSDGATLAIPRGFRASGIKAGMKESGALDMAVLAADRALCGGRHLHDQPRLRRPGEVVPGASPRGRHPGGRDQLGQCQCGDRRPGIGETPGAPPSVPPPFFGCEPEQVLVASTGIIGHQLPMDKIEAGIAMAVAGLSGHTRKRFKPPRRRS